MTTKKRRDYLKLGASIYPVGYHVAGWRYPGAEVDGGISLQHHVDLAQKAEQGIFDFLFLADAAVIWDQDLHAVARTAWSTRFEPITLLSALAMVTKRIGLVATVSTTYNEPYTVARKFASLDHISNGRAGWNLVTSAAEAESKNFNLDQHLAHADRYKRAREFVEVVTGLWDGWADDAFIYDQKSGIYFDVDKVEALNHKGTYFSVQGPLNIPRPPQGHPLMVQAGLSDDGRELAAETAEVLFTAQPSLADARSYYADVKGRMAKYGRSPDSLSIMPGVVTVIGRTRAEAEEQEQRLKELTHPVPGLAFLSGLIGAPDLSSYPLDASLPELPPTNGPKGRQRLLVEVARRENLTLRQLYLGIALTSGHRLVSGTPGDIADQLEDWFVNEGCDGYNVAPPYLPGGFNDFVDLVVPELQRRGLVRTSYGGATLREHMGLSRPADRHASRALAVG
ncbi:MAG TPA: LLM class flavin-dependent oxidoreductase [Dongiaceae bacterium]|nr:LLM class flavin-dependent oxidoreductase [Dongiaceae bacterium]